LSRTRFQCLLGLGATLVLLLAACGGGDQAPAEGGDQAGGDNLGLRQPGVMSVGSDIAFAPFEFVENNENKGFDIDLMNEIASRLGVEAQFTNTSFDTIFTQLSAGQFDAIISGITITPQRAEQITFSDPYFLAEQAIAVPPGSDITGEADLAAKVVAVQSGTTGEAYAQQNYADEATITPFPTSEAAFTALAADQVDAVFIDLPVAQRAADGGNIEVVASVETDEEYGIGVQKDNQALVDAINTQLAEIIADGTYEEIYSRWFDTEVPERFRAG
jgi:ABC-type amino acid transport substrate-binding protein